MQPAHPKSTKPAVCGFGSSQQNRVDFLIRLEEHYKDTGRLEESMRKLKTSIKGRECAEGSELISVLRPQRAAHRGPHCPGIQPAQGAKRGVLRRPLPRDGH
jgi:hypothetical protein